MPRLDEAAYPRLKRTLTARDLATWAAAHKKVRYGKSTALTDCTGGIAVICRTR
jgi:hypothetical protein